MSKDSINFYEKVGPVGLKDFGKIISIDDCLDLEKIQNLIIKSKHILEIGAGYGRVLDYLFKTNYNGEISALENCNSMFINLEKKYSNKVKILKQSAIDFNLGNSSPDLILWMWSGFGDLLLEEQKNALKNLYKNSSENSTIIIDLPNVSSIVESGKEGRIGDFNHKNIATLNHPVFGHYQGYFPNVEEMKSISKSAGFLKIKLKKYTFNDSPRIQYCLRK